MIVLTAAQLTFLCALRNTSLLATNVKPFKPSIGNQPKKSYDDLPPKEREFELREVSKENFELYDKSEDVLWFSYKKTTNYANLFRLKVSLTPQETWLLVTFTGYMPDKF